jgi:type IV pilus assembly protein PilM
MTEQFVAAEIQGMLPAASGQMIVRHTVAGEVATEGQDQREVIVVAAPQDVLEAYLAMTRRVKLEVVGVTTDAFALVECFGHLLRRSVESGRTIFFVDLGATSTKAALSHSGDVVFARNLAVGGRDLDQAVASGKGIPLAEAGALRLRLGEQGEAGDPTLPRLLDPKIDEIAGGLSQCLAYHASVFKSQGAELVVFVGAEARDRYLCQAIARRLNLPAKIGDPFTCIDGKSASVNGTDVDPDVPHPDWAVAVGLSLSGQ